MSVRSGGDEAALTSAAAAPPLSCGRRDRLWDRHVGSGDGEAGALLWAGGGSHCWAERVKNPPPGPPDLLLPGNQPEPRSSEGGVGGEERRLRSTERGRGRRRSSAQRDKGAEGPRKRGASRTHCHTSRRGGRVLLTGPVILTFAM